MSQIFEMVNSGIFAHLLRENTTCQKIWAIKTMDFHLELMKSWNVITKSFKYYFEMYDS